MRSCVEKRNKYDAIILFQNYLIENPIPIAKSALGIFAVGIFAEEFFAEGIFAEWNIGRIKFLLNGNFAKRNFRQREFSPKNSPKVSLQPGREVDGNQQSVSIGLPRKINSVET